MTAPLRTRERRLIPLDRLTGRSPFNCRPPGKPEDVAGLASSIEGVGLIHALLVSDVPGRPGFVWIDDGGDRYDAFCLLRAAGRIAADTPIACDVFVGAESEAREISLVANVMRRDLHPVDQCAAFEALIGSGRSEDEVATHFNVTTRHVRQRLRLARLSPKVREMWRAGELSAEAAQAMTAGATHAAQDALLERFKGDAACLMHDTRAIRRELVGEHIRGDHRVAIFVGIETYVAAGGALDENLFEEHPLLLDGALLDRLAREKLIREGDVILQATGFGFCMIGAEIADRYRWPRVEPDFLPAERVRLDEIEEAVDPEIEDVDEIGWQDRQQDEPVEAWETRIQAEQETIEARALDRALTPELRAKAGIFVDIAPDGTLEVERGVLQPEIPREDGGATTPRPSAASPAAPSAKPVKPADPIEAAGSGLGAIREILDATIQAALRQVVSVRWDLALVFLVARFGGAYRPHHLEEIGLSPASGREKRDGLLGAMQDVAFDKAVATCAGVGSVDLLATIAAIVGGSLKPTRQAPMTQLDPLMRAFARRGAPLRPAFVVAMDYDKYFEAATRAGILAALEAMGTDNVEKGAKKPVLAGLAAADAKQKGWLPFPLAGWAAIEADASDVRLTFDAPPSLATAMHQAIVDDEAKRAILNRWLEAQVEARANGRIKASDLYDLYCGDTPSAELLAWQAFGQTVAARGVQKKRFNAGVHYLDVALKAPRAAAS